VIHRPVAKPCTSAYHLFEQNDGRGWGILRLTGGNQAVVVDANMVEAAARDRLAAYRREEGAAA
jgi:hypothetical protein